MLSKAAPHDPHITPVYPKHEKTDRDNGSATSPWRTLFDFGKAVMTPGAQDALMDARQSPITFIIRHVTGDWGDVCTSDATANTRALTEGSRVLSVYTLSTQVSIWVITEADRSVTTILLPSEY